ncbi:hypothetical protein OKW76_13480 [Sphingomonas sp. S1-29]|nr:hypothetical protein [Sphingomonas sp. S1-29]UZK69025.1 hypothetical protein OKW76_13480 [Sphingomonas sp. S1-29]
MYDSGQRAGERLGPRMAINGGGTAGGMIEAATRPLLWVAA